MRKRIFALLLALVMALGLCVTTAWADGETVHELRQLDITSGTFWQTDYPYWLKGGSYKLMEDIELDGVLCVDGGSIGGVTIDLNGYTLSLKSGVQESVLYVAGNTLTLQDSSAAKTGKITGGTGYKDDSSDPSIGGGVEVDSGFFYMYGGTITGCTADLGGGVYVDGGGSFHMYGGTITNCTATQGGGAVYLENGTMYANGGTVNGTVYVSGDGTITASDDYANCYDKQTVFLDTVTTKNGLDGGVYKKAPVAGEKKQMWLNGGLYWVDPIAEKGAFGIEWTSHVATFMNGDDEYATAFAIVYNENNLGTSCTFAEPDTPVREGYTFLGWYYRNDDGNEVKWDFANDRAVTTEANQMGTSHTFYAKWEQNPDPTTPDEDNGGHTPIRRQNTTTITTDTTTDTTKTDTVTSAKTFDAGVAVYVGMSLMSVVGTAVVIGKKKEF